MQPLLHRGLHRHVATSMALFQSEVDALKAHVAALAMELDEKNQLSAQMADFQSQAINKMMARVKHIAALVHASALQRIRTSIPAPLKAAESPASAACPRPGCTSNDLKWMQQLSRALSLIQAQSIHQAQMMRHVTSLGHEVELLRQRLRRSRRRVGHALDDDFHMRGRTHAQLLQRGSATPATGVAAKSFLAAASGSASMRKQMLNKLLDRVQAVGANSGSPSLDGLYREIHNLQSLLSKLPNGPQKL